LSLRLGIEDPEQWLENCPERVYENWLAYYRLEPFGMEAELLSKIIGLLFYLCRKDGGQIEDIDKFCNAIARCMMPGNWVGQQPEKTTQKLSAEQLKQRFSEAQKIASQAFR
jgi:hypothetical protein